MTEEAQRIAIAEAHLGVTEIDTGLWLGYGLDEDNNTVAVEVPSYLNDRNAIWAAAESAGEATIKAMRYWLFTICGEMKAHHATAAQESKAFLCAKGLWVE